MTTDPPPSTWPISKWISPTALNTFGNCPYRARLTYVDRKEPPYKFSIHLHSGRVAHELLRHTATCLKNATDPLPQDRILDIAHHRLPRNEFPSEQAWTDQAHKLAGWVEFGKKWLLAQPAPTFLRIEQNAVRPIRLWPNVDNYTLMSRADAVLLQHDPTGAPFINIVDYKTGKIREEIPPPIIMRFDLKELIHEHLGDTQTARVLFTYIWLNERQTSRIDLSAEYCESHWTEITDAARALATEQTWPATPSILCNYCPYYQNICKEEIPPSED